MSIELKLILGFLFHLLGDYVFQNNWMAQNKVKSFWPAYIHALIYSIPFLFLTGSGWMVIFITHYYIDRYRLASYWIKLVNWNWESKNHGFDNNTPAYLSTWVMIIVDNTFHIVINSLTIISL
jgi:hypothetical protein